MLSSLCHKKNKTRRSVEHCTLHPIIKNDWNCTRMHKKFLLWSKEEDNNGEEYPFADVDELEAFSEPEDE